MITEDYVGFETAKLLKEKGFNESCNKCYLDSEQLIDSSNELWREYNSSFTKVWNGFSAPTLQMAMKWLREVHQIFIRPNTSFLYPIKWYSEIFCYGDNLKTQQDVKTEYYDSPEESYEAAIKYCLINLI